MSTKLYDGLKLRDPSQDIFEVFKIIDKEIKKVFKPLVINLALEEISHYEPTEEERKENSLIIFLAEEKWMKRQTDLGEYHTLNDPLRFSIVFGRTSKGNILAYPYYSQPEYKEALEKTGLFEDYGYWNNIDEPEDVPYEDFKMRGVEWAELENEDGTFSSLPLYKLADTKRPFSVMYLLSNEEKKEMPSLNDVYTIEKRFENSLHKQLVAKIIELDNNAKDEIITVFFEVRRAVKNYMENNDFESLLPKPFETNYLLRANEYPEPVKYEEELLLAIIENDSKLEERANSKN